METKVFVINNTKLLKYFYWILPLLLFIFQIIFTINSVNQIRYEELAESVRNVFWLKNGIIYDGISSNVGWYGTLLFIYNIFGFGLNSAKIFRLLLHLVSLYCLSAVLIKYLGTKKALIPLITIGISPSLIYFNILQTSYGVDLQYLPISLYLLTIISDNGKKLWIMPDILFWLLNMWAWMSYPTYLYYLPALSFSYFYLIRQKYHQNKRLAVQKIFLFPLVFLSPLLLSYLSLSNRNILFFDPIEKSGIFRGAGNITLNTQVLFNNISHLITDLFSKGNSYYFEYIKGEFSDLYPIVSLIVIFLFLPILYKSNAKLKKIIILTFSVFLFCLFVSNFAVDPTTHPGLRRNTPLLAAFYIFYIFVWSFITSNNWRSLNMKWLLIGIMLLLPIHHLIVYPQNLAALNNPSIYREQTWFNFSNNPAESLDIITESVRKNDLPLSCKNEEDQLAYCRYSEIYAAIAGNCAWNHISCKTISGYDPKTQKFIRLSTSVWEKYYWSH